MMIIIKIIMMTIILFCRSYSWSANICGRKRWLLYPPNEEQSFKDRLGNLPFDVTSSEMKDAEKYPNFNKAIQPIEIIQEEGEVVFIPRFLNSTCS